MPLLILALVLQQTVHVPTRLEWQQTTWSNETIDDIETLLAVDGAPPEPVSRTCSPLGPQLHRCSVPLPPLSPGVHTLVLTARTRDYWLVTDESASIQVVTFTTTELRP